MTRNVFDSFHFVKDNWRVSQVRSIGVIEGNKPVTDNDWEAIKKGGDKAIQTWIDGQLSSRTCTIVLIGSETAGRKWINYEIEKSWKDNKGVVGIRIHNLKDKDGNQSIAGANPFNLNVNGLLLLNIVKIYNPPSTDSKAVYQNIAENMNKWVEEAIQIRNKYP